MFSSGCGAYIGYCGCSFSYARSKTPEVGELHQHSIAGGIGLVVGGVVNRVQLQRPQLNWELPSSVPQGWMEDDPAGLAVLGMR